MLDFLSLDVQLGRLHGVLNAAALTTGCRRQLSLMSMFTLVSGMILVVLIVSLILERVTLLLLLLGECLDDLHLAVLLNELVDIHVATADANNKLSINNLGQNLLGAEHVLARFDPHDLDLAAIVRALQRCRKHDIDRILLVRNIIVMLNQFHFGFRLLAELLLECLISFLVTFDTLDEVLRSSAQFLNVRPMRAIDSHITVDLVHRGILNLLLALAILDILGFIYLHGLDHIESLIFIFVVGEQLIFNSGNFVEILNHANDLTLRLGYLFPFNGVCLLSTFLKALGLALHKLELFIEILVDLIDVLADELKFIVTSYELVERIPLNDLRLKLGSQILLFFNITGGLIDFSL